MKHLIHLLTWKHFALTLTGTVLGVAGWELLLDVPWQSIAAGAASLAPMLSAYLGARASQHRFRRIEFRLRVHRDRLEDLEDASNLRDIHANIEPPFLEVAQSRREASGATR